jgi:hypothetical protein
MKSHEAVGKPLSDNVMNGGFENEAIGKERHAHER